MCSSKHSHLGEDFCPCDLLFLLNSLLGSQIYLITSLSFLLTFPYSFLTVLVVQGSFCYTPISFQWDLFHIFMNFDIFMRWISSASSNSTFFIRAWCLHFCMTALWSESFCYMSAHKSESFKLYQASFPEHLFHDWVNQVPLHSVVHSINVIQSSEDWTYRSLLCSLVLEF